jgi:hypothetical protein
VTGTGDARRSAAKFNLHSQTSPLRFAHARKPFSASSLEKSRTCREPFSHTNIQTQFRAQIKASAPIGETTDVNAIYGNIFQFAAVIASPIEPMI